MPDPEIPPGRKFLKCFCSMQPILAVYGTDQYGEPFVHLKVWKQRRLFGEAIFKGGTVQLLCRECTRWHVINIRPNQPVQIRETEKPAELEAGVYPTTQVESVRTLTE
jgi:hypothetical protein